MDARFARWRPSLLGRVEVGRWLQRADAEQVGVSFACRSKLEQEGALAMLLFQPERDFSATLRDVFFTRRRGCRSAECRCCEC